MSDISKFAPDVLRHAEHLLQEMRQYEAAASVDNYQYTNNPERLLLFMGIGFPALELEKSLCRCGFSSALPAMPNTVDANLYNALAGIHGICRSARLSRHAETKRKRAEVLQTWGIQGDGGWGLVPGKDKTLPKMGRFAEGLAPLVELLRRSLTPAKPSRCELGAPRTNDDPALDKEGELVLSALADDPRRRFIVRAIWTKLNRKVSEKTIGQRLGILIDAGLAQRDAGQKSGAAITEAGRAYYREMQTSRIAAG